MHYNNIFITNFRRKIRCISTLRLFEKTNCRTSGVFALETLNDKHLAWYHLVCKRFSLEPVAKPTCLVMAQTVAKVLKQEQVDRSFLDEI